VLRQLAPGAPPLCARRSCSSSSRTRASATARAFASTSARSSARTRTLAFGLFGHLEQAPVVVDETQPHGLACDRAHRPVEAQRETWRAVASDLPLDEVLADAVPRTNPLPLGGVGIEAQEQG
jgi:hypothetical protein